MALGVALGDSGIDASSQSGLIGSPSGEESARQNGELYFSNVEPTAEFRGVVKFQLSGDGAGLLRWERLIQRSRFVRIEVVQHDANDLDVGVHLNDMLRGPGKLDLGAPVGDQHLAQSASTSRSTPSAPRTLTVKWLRIRAEGKILGEFWRPHHNAW